MARTNSPKAEELEIWVPVRGREPDMSEHVFYAISEEQEVYEITVQNRISERDNRLNGEYAWEWWDANGDIDDLERDSRISVEPQGSIVSSSYRHDLIRRGTQAGLIFVPGSYIVITLIGIYFPGLYQTIVAIGQLVFGSDLSDLALIIVLIIGILKEIIEHKINLEKYRNRFTFWRL